MGARLNARSRVVSPLTRKNAKPAECSTFEQSMRCASAVVLFCPMTETEHSRRWRARNPAPWQQSDPERALLRSCNETAAATRIGVQRGPPGTLRENGHPAQSL